MFENIEKKIKKAASVVLVAGIIADVILAIIMFVVGAEIGEDLFTTYGVLFLIAGPLCTWLNCLFIYGFGELIEKVSVIAKNTQSEKSLCRDAIIHKTEENEQNEDIEILNKLRIENLITEEEYQDTIRKYDK